MRPLHKSLLVTINCLLIGIVFYINTPVRGFLPSLYHGISPVVLLFAIFLFLLLYVSSHILVGKEYVLYVYGLLSISIFHLFPVIRTNFTATRGDGLAHISMVRSVLELGQFDPSMNFYPGIHLLISQPAIVTGIDIYILPSILQVSLTLLFPVFWLLIARRLTTDIKIHNAIFFLSLAPMFGQYSVQIIPNGMVMNFSVLILYAILRMNIGRKRWGIVLILAAPFLVISHPLFVIMFSGGLAVSSMIQYRKNRKRTYRLLGYITCIGVLFCAWYILTTTVWEYHVTRILYVLMGNEVGFTDSGRVGSRLSGISFIEQIELFFVRYSGRLIISVLTIIGILFFVGEFEKKHNVLYSPIILIFGLVWFVINAVFMAISLIEPDAAFSVFRFVNMIYLSTPIFVILSFKYFFEGVNKGIFTENSQVTQIVTVGLLLVLIFSLCAFPLYAYDRTTGFNPQITGQELDGSSWMLDNKNEEIEVRGFGNYRYERSLLGEHRYSVEDDIPPEYSEYFLPAKLKSDGIFITELYDRPMYIRIMQSDHIQGRNPVITGEEEDLLSGSENRIYNNPEYRLYYMDRGAESTS